jgi:hypothetical protein
MLGVRLGVVGIGIGSSGVNSVGFNQSKADENSKTVSWLERMLRF